MTGKWYLRSDGYMTSKCDYQEIEHMKADRAIEHGENLVFVKKGNDGEELGNRVYLDTRWIVRCVDCKWLENDSLRGPLCRWFCVSLHDDYDGYCAWGERKDS